jgi:hypothetical protein
VSSGDPRSAVAPNPETRGLMVVETLKSSTSVSPTAIVFMPKDFSATSTCAISSCFVAHSVRRWTLEDNENGDSALVRVTRRVAHDFRVFKDRLLTHVQCERDNYLAPIR